MHHVEAEQIDVEVARCGQIGYRQNDVANANHAGKTVM